MGGGKAPKEYLEDIKKEEIKEGTQKILFGEDPMERCINCGERRNRHIDYFNTGKKDVCPNRKSMKFAKLQVGRKEK